MRMLTTLEKAKELNVSERALKDWRKRGVGPEFKQFGRAVRYYPDGGPLGIEGENTSDTGAS
ncbi:MAG: hypothetical protein ABJO27_14870 [Pseudoruegeria sp.]